MTIRRTMFLHTGAAFNLPVVADGAVAPARRPGPAPCSGCDDDPVAAEALRQLRAGVRAQAAGRGEGARQAASALRLLAAHGTATRLDDQFRHLLRREVDTYGGDSVLLRQVSPARLLAEARALGLDALPFLLNPDVAARRRVLESLLTFGVTPYLVRAANFFETFGGELDTHGRRRARRVARDEQHSSRVREWVAHAEVAMIVGCLSPAVVSCGVFAGVYMGARIHHDRFGRARSGHRTPTVAADRPRFQESG